jgi:hypothetical protein
MKVVYLAGPYTHDDPMVREHRYHVLLKAEAYLLRKGLAVISPINMCHELGKIYGFQYGYDFWQSRDRTLITKCEEVIVITEPGWKESVGVTDEIFWANECNIPVSYIAPEELVIDGQ